MLAVISPAKTLDFKTPPITTEYTMPEYLDESEKLAGKLKKLSAKKISALMNISPSLGTLNYNRFQNWHRDFSPENAKQAILAFNGDVYSGLQAISLSEGQLDTAQQKLRIISGLYGILKPLDLIQPYRLEMGTKTGYRRSKDLYSFWGDKITRKVQKAIQNSGNRILVNLASAEYFKSINTKKLDAEIVTPVFMDLNSGEYKQISIYFKKARGMMARFIIENNIENAEDLLAFDDDGYHFNPQMSKPGKPVFTREQS